MNLSWMEANWMMQKPMQIKLVECVGFYPDGCLREETWGLSLRSSSRIWGRGITSNILTTEWSPPSLRDIPPKLQIRRNNDLVLGFVTENFLSMPWFYTQINRGIFYLRKEIWCNRISFSSYRVGPDSFSNGRAKSFQILLLFSDDHSFI